MRPTKNVQIKRPARIDFFGGTLDLPPLHLILPKVVTVNAAVSLYSDITVEAQATPELQIVSQDYQETVCYPLSELTEKNIDEEKRFGKFQFVVEVFNTFPWREYAPGFKISFRSTIPPGSGLGGSSVMGMTLIRALSNFFDQALTANEMLKIVSTIESRVLDCGPTGYQDYYPSVYGGLLALKPTVKGIEVEQLWEQDFCMDLSRESTLCYSGQSRFSAINNWEVYKGFFDRDASVHRHMREGLGALAQIAAQAYGLAKTQKSQEFLKLLIAEGQMRTQLFAKIRTPEMERFLKSCGTHFAQIGMKVCGAGGGGCFLMVHPGVPSSDFQAVVKQKWAADLQRSKIEILQYQILPPAQDVC